MTYHNWFKEVWTWLQQSFCWLCGHDFKTTYLNIDWQLGRVIHVCKKCGYEESYLKKI